MTEVVYPKLFDLMEHNDMKKVVIKLKGANDLTINNDRKVTWEQPTADVAQNEETPEYEIKPDCDPVFRSYGNKKGLYASENDMYVSHCQAVMDKIVHMENMTSKIDDAIERASKIGLVFERVVLTEKIKNV
jgi:hypothetical protein